MAEIGPIPSRRNALPLWTSLLLVAPLIALLGWTYFLPIARLLLTSVTVPTLNVANYARLIAEPLYGQIFMRTIWIAFAATVLALICGYPIAALMARPKSRVVRIVAVCVMVPLWTSVLIRSYAWIMLLRRNGIVNNWLIGGGLAEQPLTLLYTEGAVLMAMTHILMPFMILPIYSSLRSVPPELPKAALNLGASRLRAFIAVTLPLSLPGVFAGCLIVFVMALGFYITPALLGGPRTMMIATLIAQQAMDLLNWPFAGAISLVLLVLSLGIAVTFKRLLRLDRVIARD